MFDLAALAQPNLKLRSLDVGTPAPQRGRMESTIASLEAEPAGLVHAIQRACGFGRTMTVTLTSHRVERIVRGRNEAMTTSVPLSSLASVMHGHSKPLSKLIVGMMLAMFGLAGVFAIGPKAVFGLLVGGAVIAWHFLSSPKFTVLYSSTNGVSLYLKVSAGKQTDDLVAFAEASMEQLRVNALPSPSAPPLPASQPGYAARA